MPITERAQKRPRAEEPEDIPAFKYTATPVVAPKVNNEKREVSSPVFTLPRSMASKMQLAAIVARATEAADAAREAEAKAAADAEEAAEKKRLAKQRRKERVEKKEKEREKSKQKKGSEKPSSSTSKPVDKDKQLVKLVGEVVVKYMSHYKDQMEHDTFKKHAKEVNRQAIRNILR